MIATSARPAGLRESRRCRTTGHMVSIYDGGPAGMDTFAGRWQTVCEAHGGVISHTTLATARSWLAAAAAWCEECQDELARAGGLEKGRS